MSVMALTILKGFLEYALDLLYKGANLRFLLALVGRGWFFCFAVP